MEPDAVDAAIMQGRGRGANQSCVSKGRCGRGAADNPTKQDADADAVVSNRVTESMAHFFPILILKWQMY